MIKKILMKSLKIGLTLIISFCFVAYFVHRIKTSSLMREPLELDMSRKHFGFYENEIKEIDPQMEIVGMFNDFPAISKEKMLYNASNSKISFITLQVQDNYDYDKLIDGYYDEELTSYFQELSKILKRDVCIIRLCHEMEFYFYNNNSWYPWQDLPPKKYINIYRKIVDVSRTIPDLNIKWAWSPYSLKDKKVIEYYPGDDYADFIGTTINMHTFNAEMKKRVSSYEYRFNKFVDMKFVRSMKKPLFITETGISAYIENEKGKEVIDERLDELLKRYKETDEIFGMMYLDLPIVKTDDGRSSFFKIQDRAKFLPEIKEIIPYTGKYTKK